MEREVNLYWALALAAFAGGGPPGDGLAQSFQQPFEPGLAVLHSRHAFRYLLHVFSHARLHPQGPHPWLSDEHDSTFRLHLVLLTAQLLLNRLQQRVPI